MEILYLLLPVALILVGIIAWLLLWAIRSGQFDDLEGPARQILMDEDKPFSQSGNRSPMQEKPPESGKKKGRAVRPAPEGE